MRQQPPEVRCWILTGRRVRSASLLVNGTDRSALQGAAAPVHRDVAEQPVLDFVPFAGAGRQVADVDGEAGLGGESGQFGLPLSGAVAVGAAAVGADQQSVRARVAALADAGPPVWMLSTANSAVSWSVPTLTQPVSAATS